MRIEYTIKCPACGHDKIKERMTAYDENQAVIFANCEKCKKEIKIILKVSELNDGGKII